MPQLSEQQATAAMHAQLCLTATPWSVAHQAPLSTGFSRQEYWSRLPCPPPGNLPNPGIETVSPALAGGFLTTVPPGPLGKPRESSKHQWPVQGCHDLGHGTCGHWNWMQMPKDETFTGNAFSDERTKPQKGAILPLHNAFLPKSHRFLFEVHLGLLGSRYPQVTCSLDSRFFNPKMGIIIHPILPYCLFILIWSLIEPSRGTFLMVQWLRLWLPKHGVQVQSLVGGDRISHASLPKNPNIKQK